MSISVVGVFQQLVVYGNGLGASAIKRNQYNKAITTYEALNNLTPEYITNLLKPMSCSLVILRFSEFTKFTYLTA